MSSQPEMNETEMLAALEWQSAAGVSIAVAEVAINQFESQQSVGGPGAQNIAPIPQPADRPRVAAASIIAPDGDASVARELARGAGTLDELREAMDGFEGSPLKQRATQLVFGDGNPQAEIMLIGEAPGKEEDLQGAPFVGRSGQLLDRMLAAIGLDRTSVYIANTVPWRPPGNRTPTPAEIQVCLPFLHRQIELVAPRVIVTLGAPASQTLFGEPVSITKVRGQWRELKIGAVTIRALPTFHPAFLLRQPAQKAHAWSDMATLKKEMESWTAKP